MGSFVENVNKVAALIPAESVNLGVVVDNIDNINLLKPVITDLQSIVDNVVPNISEILLADDNAQTATAQAVIATTKAGEASTSATNALASKVQAGIYRNEAEAFNKSKAFVVDTVEDLLTIPSSYVTAIVRDLNRGGTFIWSATGTSNGGTVFAGVSGFWTRQYSGAVSVKWFGAKGDGVSDDTLSFEKAYIFNNLTIPSGTYYLTEFNTTDKNIKITISNEAYFNNYIPDFSGETLLIPNIPDPIYSSEISVKNYSSAYWGTYNGNIFHKASFVETDATNMHADGINLVSNFMFARANGSGSSVWGSNIVAYSNNATAKAIGIELNTGVLQSGGTAYGLVVASAGNYQPENAMQIQANNSSSVYKNGIKFNRSGNDCVAGALILANGTGEETSQYLLQSNRVKYSNAEIDIPSFIVSATPATVDARVRVAASYSTTARIEVSATSENATLQLRSKGTGYVQLADDSGNTNVSVSSKGVGFNGTTAITKPTVSGSRGGNEALGSLISALSAYGLITNATTV